MGGQYGGTVRKVVRDGTKRGEIKCNETAIVMENKIRHS